MTNAQPKPRFTNAAREALTCYLFLLPWGIGFLAFVLGPVAASFVLGFMDYEIVTPARWVGLANYIELFTDDRRFGLSLGNTLYYVLVFVPLHILVALLLALLLNQKARGIAVYRTLFYVPSIVPLVAGAILWVWILQPEWGLINSTLRELLELKARSGWLPLTGPNRP